MKHNLVIPSAFHLNNRYTLMVRVPSDIARCLGKTRGDKCVVEMVSEKELRILME